MTCDEEINFGQLVESLNDDDCLDVIRLLIILYINKQLGVNSLTIMVNQIITHLTQNFTNKSLIGIEEAIKNTYSSHSTKCNDYKFSVLHKKALIKAAKLLPNSKLWLSLEQVKTYFLSHVLIHYLQIALQSPHPHHQFLYIHHSAYDDFSSNTQQFHFFHRYYHHKQ